jgi:hypothetical protein
MFLILFERLSIEDYSQMSAVSKVSTDKHNTVAMCKVSPFHLFPRLDCQEDSQVTESTL